MQRQLYKKTPSVRFWVFFLFPHLSTSVTTSCFNFCLLSFYKYASSLWTQYYQIFILYVVTTDWEYSGSRYHPVRCMTTIVWYSANTLSICSYTAVWTKQWQSFLQKSKTKKQAETAQNACINAEQSIIGQHMTFREILLKYCSVFWCNR